MSEQSSLDGLSQEELARIVLSSEFHQQRKNAALLLHDIQLIVQTLKHIKTHDKGIAKILQAKCTADKKRREKNEATNQRLHELTTAAQKLSNQPWSKHYPNQYQHLLRTWKQFQQDNALNSDEFDRHIEKCHLMMETHQTVIDAEQQLTAFCNEWEADLLGLANAESNTVMAHAITVIKNQRNRVTQYTPYLTYLSSFHSLQQQYKQLNQKHARLAHSVEYWLKNEQNCTTQCPNNIQNATQAEQLYALAAQNEKIIHELKWPDFAPIPRTVAEVQNAQCTIAAKVTATRKMIDQHHNKIKTNLPALQHKLRTQQLKAAFAIYMRVEALLPYLKKSDSLSKKCVALMPQLDELIDWQDYTTKEKRRQLCTSMQQLIATKEHPAELSKKITALQKEWAQLGHTKHQDLWDEFHQSAERAYHPIKVFRQQRAEQRKTNMQKRQQLCEELATHIAQFDRQQLSSDTLLHHWRTMQKEWDRHAYIDKKATHSLMHRYEELNQHIKERLAPTFAHNSEKKRALLERLTQLCAGENPTDHDTHQVKLLQTAWKQIGPSQQEDERELNQQFKEQADSFFGKKLALHNERKNKSKNQIRQAKEIIAAIKKLCTRKSPPPPHTYQNERERFHTLELSRDRHAALYKQFQQVCDQYENMSKKWEKIAEENAYAECQRLAEICQQLEIASLDSKGDHGALIDRSHQVWEESRIALAQNQLRTMLHQRYEYAIDALRTTQIIDFTEAISTRRLLCVRAEILADIDSPSQDKTLRMDYQINRLKNNFNAQKNEDTVATLQHEWLIIPVAGTQHARLQKRFDAALAQLKDKPERGN